MDKIREWLKGKKAYIVCIGAILAAVAAWSSGEINTIHAIEAIVAALGGITLRAGIADAAKPAVKKK